MTLFYYVSISEARTYINGSFQLRIHQTRIENIYLYRERGAVSKAQSLWVRESTTTPMTLYGNGFRRNGNEIQ